MPPEADTHTKINAELASELKAFCASLFTNVIGLKAVTSRFGEIREHYEAFVTVNHRERCPYCGYGTIMGRDRTRRDAYDHFLPKGTYPFNTVNFHNLAPMCHECNSSYKLEKDQIRKRGGDRRKAFYSYAEAHPARKDALAIADIPGRAIDANQASPFARFS